ncbi:hypothetical protein BJ546DRAFT_210727 [Cryomyces antarcticus]
MFINIGKAILLSFLTFTTLTTADDLCISHKRCICVSAHSYGLVEQITYHDGTFPDHTGQVFAFNSTCINAINAFTTPLPHGPQPAPGNFTTYPCFRQAELDWECHVFPAGQGRGVEHGQRPENSLYGGNDDSATRAADVAWANHVKPDGTHRLCRSPTFGRLMFDGTYRKASNRHRKDAEMSAAECEAVCQEQLAGSVALDRKGGEVEEVWGQHCDHWDLPGKHRKHRKAKQAVPCLKSTWTKLRRVSSPA